MPRDSAEPPLPPSLLPPSSFPPPPFGYHGIRADLSAAWSSRGVERKLFSPSRHRRNDICSVLLPYRGAKFQFKPASLIYRLVSDHQAFQPRQKEFLRDAVEGGDRNISFRRKRREEGTIFARRWTDSDLMIDRNGVIRLSRANGRGNGSNSLFSCSNCVSNYIQFRIPDRFPFVCRLVSDRIERAIER